jgi:DNA-binding NtrC family response regulator
MIANKLSVMLVDDDMDIVTTTGMGLKRAGYDVHAFSDPLMAVQHVEQDSNKCEVLISDIRMPKMNGFQLVRRVNELRPHMKIIMMTAYEVNPPEFQTMFPTLRVDSVLKKPFPPSKLAEAIKESYKLEKAHVPPQINRE